MKNITKIASIPSHTSKLRVAAYCRVSTESDAQLESLETQKSHYERYIASRDDWEFAGIYYDEGISGTKKENRSELLRLMADCKAKKIDHIITKSISRFSRNTTDCLELIRKLLQLNVTVFFEKENINTGSMESELFFSHPQNRGVHDILSLISTLQSLLFNSGWDSIYSFRAATTR